MNIGGGEAADQLVRMMLSGSEVAVRLSGSAIKNVLALTMALAKNHKTISGKVNLVKMLKETRDVRRFAMSPEQYQQFRQRAGKQKILFSAIRDSDNKGKVVDVIMPVISSPTSPMWTPGVGSSSAEALSCLLWIISPRTSSTA